MPDKPYVGKIYPARRSLSKEDISRRAGQERRDTKFIEAIMDESRKRGKPLNWEQAKRELASQQRLSQKEILWQEHRDTLTEEYPTGEARRPAIKQKITKPMAAPPEDRMAALERRIQELMEENAALRESVKEANFQNKQLIRELNK